MGDQKTKREKEREIKNCVTKGLVIIRTIIPQSAWGKSLNYTPCFFFLSISS